ncbi:uncharacterized protein LOC131981948 isoform X2 [Centropristis striata]|uniref:uncharacterized protein LOC131981948 isoform X2 n=1 Tax=Centropristis striata TaxID=184440 RepID=UPI0027DFD4A2|nr:uncharacterized protein LOC131981948 isoform X2 [Centropristis striata]
MRVSCSSEGGDSPQYSWTLDGRTLTDAELLPGNTETKSITLKQHVSGQLVCSVRNDVSRVSEEEKISNCGFIFINCTSDNETHSQWVFAANNTLCVETTTTPMITETSGVGSTCDGRQDGKQSIETTTPTTTTETDHSLLICGVRSAVVILILIGITVYYAWKKKKNKMAEGSAVRRRMLDQENSVVMVEVGSSSYENFNVVNTTS